MLLFYLIIFEYIIKINCLIVGKMSSISLNLPSWSPRLMNALILNGTCEECLCNIIMNSSVLNVGSFNCFINNKTCQVFSKGTFYQYSLNNDILFSRTNRYKQIL